MKGTCSRCKTKKTEVQKFENFQLCKGCYNKAGGDFSINHKWIGEKK